MSNSILDYIIYNRQRYHETNDPSVKEKIIELSKKLSHLEPAIVQHKSGTIVKMPSGIVFIDSFPDELKEQIKQAIG